MNKQINPDVQDVQAITTLLYYAFTPGELLELLRKDDFDDLLEKIAFVYYKEKFISVETVRIMCGFDLDIYGFDWESRGIILKEEEL